MEFHGGETDKKADRLQYTSGLLVRSVEAFAGTSFERRGGGWCLKQVRAYPSSVSGDEGVFRSDVWGARPDLDETHQAR